jgi:hypothetical protein
LSAYFYIVKETRQQKGGEHNHKTVREEAVDIVKTSNGKIESAEPMVAVN